MRTQSVNRRRQSGFTLAEAVVTTSIATLVGLAFTYVFFNASILYAKNTAENTAHDQNRIAVNRIVRDIHSAVSIPQLGKIVPGNLAANPAAPTGSWTPYGTNVTFWAESGTGPAAGVSFKKMGNSFNPNGGPFEVRNDPGNVDLIQIDSGTSNPPHAGMEIIFPYYGMEGTINKVTSTGANHYNVWIDGGLETRIKKKKDTAIIAYYMSRYAYVVENGDLKFYSSSMPPAGVTWPIVVARNVCEPPSKDTPKVKVYQTYFQPANVTIRRGESVRWEWRSTGNRSATSKATTPPAHKFDSGNRREGAADFLHAFKDAGTYQYQSKDDPSMVGTVTVLPRSYNAKPFSQASSQYVTVNLTTEDNRYSNRNYKSVNTLLAGSVPIRAQLSKSQ